MIKLFAASLLLTVAIASPAQAPKVAKVTVNQPVTLVDNGDSWTLDNGIVKMSVLKRNGTMPSAAFSITGSALCRTAASSGRPRPRAR